MTQPIRTLRPVNRPAHVAKTFVPVSIEMAQSVSVGYYLPLIQRLVEIRKEQGSGVIAAFASISSGEGVTFVVESLAWELAKQTGEQVLLTTPSGLNDAELALLLFADKRPSPVTRLTGTGGDQRLLQEIEPKDLDALRDRFGFVLVDCPAMRQSSTVLALSKVIDGVVLVTAAGEVRRGEIEYTRSVFHTTSSKIIGLVLNKRVDPIPKFLSRLL